MTKSLVVIVELFLLNIRHPDDLKILSIESSGHIGLQLAATVQSCVALFLGPSQKTVCNFHKVVQQYFNTTSFSCCSDHVLSSALHLFVHMLKGCQAKNVLPVKVSGTLRS